MATYSGQRIPDSGLIFALDAGNTKSYPGTGNTWFDIAGRANASLGSSVTYSSSNGGVLNFDGTSTGLAVVSSSLFDLRSSDYTVITATRYTGAGPTGRVVTSNANNWLIGNWGGQVNKYYAEGWVSNSGGDTAETSWIIWAGTGNISTDTWELYRNSSLLYSNTGGSAGPYGISAGGNSGELSDSQVGFILAYNRVLTSPEISEIYYIYRSRYGI